MSTSPPAPTQAAATTGGKATAPPEEQFWERYSPHNEAPLSGVSSTVIHLLIIGLIVLVVWVQSFLKLDEVHKSLPVEPIRYDGGGGGGAKGGGAPGDGNGIGQEFPGDGDISPEDVNHQNKAPAPEHQKLAPAEASKTVEVFGKEGEALAQRPTTGSRAITDLGQGAREKLRRNVGGGKGGSGSGGGRDTGRDKGEGGGTGDGKGLTDREKRQLRWAMTFNTRNGTDYLNQLKSLKAVIAIPIDENAGTYRLIEDLGNPQNAPQKDVSGLDRIFWIDDKPESVAAIFQVLGHPKQRFFVAFFPQDLEKRMERLELAFTEQKYRHRDVNKIHETKFEAFPTGKKGTDSAGKAFEEYDVKVTAVYLKQK